MSALDPNLLSLMTVPVTWEAFNGFNDYGEPSYKAAVTKSCWLEERGYGGGGQARREADETIVDPRVDIYLDATDPDVQAMTMYDRFTLPTGSETAQPMSSQPERMNIFYGPTGDPWVKVVTL